MVNVTEYEGKVISFGPYSTKGKAMNIVLCLQKMYSPAEWDYSEEEAAWKAKRDNEDITIHLTPVIFDQDYDDMKQKYLTPDTESKKRKRSELEDGNWRVEEFDYEQHDKYSFRTEEEAFEMAVALMKNNPGWGVWVMTNNSVWERGSKTIQVSKYSYEEDIEYLNLLKGKHNKE